MSLLFRLGLLLLGLALPVHAAETARILIIGDSITAGHGLSPNEAFPSLLQKKFDALTPGWTVVNAGVSGDTSAGGLRRMNWLLKQPAPKIVVTGGRSREKPPGHGGQGPHL
jgi:acyl-CoA thioesterase-1